MGILRINFKRGRGTHHHILEWGNLKKLGN
jgi:hypothetical protein